MVDFQSRDTSRGESEDDRAEDEEPDESPGRTEETGADDDRGFAVVSITNDRTVEDDPPGDAAADELEAVGGEIVTREVIRPTYDGVQSRLDTLVERKDVVAVLTVGGTGVEPNDVTVDAVEPMLGKSLPGFGELLRSLCYDTEGSAVIRTRAVAGTVDTVPVFCLPAHPVLARRATADIVVPEAEVLADLAADEEA